MHCRDIVSIDQVVAIQIFGNNIQNANGLAVRFEYDASQVVYEGFDVGEVCAYEVERPLSD